MSGDRERCLEILSDIYLAAGVAIWLRSPNAHLGHRSPNDLIARGHGAQVVAEAERLAGGNW